MLRRLRLSGLAASAALATLCALAPVAAQQPPEPASAAARELSFGEIVEVQLVNVDVWVTDANNLPVSGLPASAFEVLEDGRPVEVSHFAEVHPPRGGREASMSSPAGDAGDADEQTAEADSPAHLVLYFDEARLPPSGRKRLVRDLREFVASDSVAAGRVLILRQTDLLSIEASFGSTTEELEAALERLEAPLPIGVKTTQEQRLGVRRLEDLWREAQQLASGGDSRATGLPAPCDYFLPRAVPEVERIADQAARRTFTTLDHLGGVASFLAGLRGVKTLVYLGNAMEDRPGAGLMAFVDDVCPASNQSTSFALVRRELSEALRALTRHANANQITIYALQAGGLQTTFLGSAEQSSVDFRGTRRFETVLRNTARGGLEYLARETGGRAVFDTNRFGRHLARIGQEMTGYYTLAYAPPHGGDGREHRIEVRLLGYPKLRVRHRRGYRDKDSYERMTERLEGAIFLGLVSNPLGARLGAGALVDSGEGGLTLPLHVLVPVDRLTFLDSLSGDPSRPMAHLKVLVVARDARGLRSAGSEREFRIVRSSTDRDEIADLTLALELEPGAHTIGVAIRDLPSGDTTYISTSIDVEEGATQEAATGRR